MSCDPTATPEDVWQILMRPVDESQRSYLEAQLEQSELRLKMTLAKRGISMDSIKSDPDRLRLFYHLVVEAVVRMERNTNIRDGYRSESEGDYSYSVATARDVSGHLWWPDDDLSMLLPRRGKLVGTVRTPLMRRRVR